jgi:hypothetical protein
MTNHECRVLLAAVKLNCAAHVLIEKLRKRKDAMRGLRKAQAAFDIAWGKGIKPKSNQ